MSPLRCPCGFALPAGLEFVTPLVMAGCQTRFDGWQCVKCGGRFEPFKPTLIVPPAPRLCRCVMKDGERFADAACFAKHDTAAVGYVAKRASETRAAEVVRVPPEP